MTATRRHRLNAAKFSGEEVRVLPGLLALSSLMANFGPPDPWVKDENLAGKAVRLPLEAAARPLTVPFDHFGVTLSGSLFLGARDQWLAPLEAAAGYGLDSQLELGIRLLRVDITPAGDGGGLLAPTVYGIARAVLGPLELGGRLDLELPLQGFREVDLYGLGRLHLGRIARVDVDLGLGGRFGGSTTWPGAAAVRMVFSPLKRFGMGGGALVESSDLFGSTDLQLRPAGRLILTVGNRSSAPLVDLELRVTGPAAELRSRADLPLAFDPRSWRGTFNVVLFFDDPNNGPSDGPW